jgi:hypothetical protein
LRRELVKTAHTPELIAKLTENGNIVASSTPQEMADCVHHVLALRDQNIDLPQLRDDLFRLVSLPCNYSPP